MRRHILGSVHSKLAAMIPPGYIVRRPTAEDAPAITACVIAFEKACFSEPDFSVTELEDEWSRPRFDVESDAWIVLDPSGAVAGYASVWDEIPHQDLSCDAVVHPEQRGRGLGSLLVDLMEERAADHFAFGRGQVLLHNVVAGPDSNAQRLLESRGYERVRMFLRMVIDLGAPRPPILPAGISIAPLRRGFDERDFYDTMKASFTVDFRFSEFHPYDEWAQRMALWDFDPSLWWLAWDQEQPVGVLEGRPLEDGDGWVKNVAVRPSHRRRGVAAALLASCFGEFRARGAKKVSLGVDSLNPTRATALYERSGMTPERSYHFYRKEFRAESALRQFPTRAGN